MDAPPGHLFIIDGDLTKIDCDAVLVPVDAGLQVTRAWWSLLGIETGRLEGHRRFAAGERAMPFDPTQIAQSTRAGTSPAPTIWLGDIGTDDADDDWYAEGLVRFVEQAAAATKPREAGRPARLAVNLAGSGEGGSAHDKGLLFTTIVPALAEAAAAHGVDVVLVCWGPKPYAAAQRARREALRVRSQRELDDRLAQVAIDLAEHARRGDLVLFLGAGVSMGAGLQSWKGLLAALADGVPDTNRPPMDDMGRLDVRDQAEIIRKCYSSPDQFRHELERLLASTTRYSLAHGLLAGLQTKENVTTNYDDLFEAAASTARRTIASLPHESSKDRDRWLLKLHGSVGRDSDLVLTREDYLGLPSRAGALFGLLQAMLMTKHMLFVGYSLTDDSFHKVIHEVKAAFGDGPPQVLGTALVLFKDPLLEKLWGDTLSIVPMVDLAGCEPTDTDFVGAARLLDVVLDDVGARAADAAPFLLDPTYRTLLTKQEHAIAEHLERTPGIESGSDSPIVDRIRNVLAELGADHQASADIVGERLTPLHDQRR